MARCEFCEQSGLALWRGGHFGSLRGPSLWRGANFVHKVGWRCEKVANDPSAAMQLQAGKLLPQLHPPPHRLEVTVNRNRNLWMSCEAALQSLTWNQHQQVRVDDVDLLLGPVRVNFPVPLKSAELQTCFFQRTWARRLLVKQF